MLDALNIVFVPPDSSLLYEGHYDPVLVVLSVVAAICASYAALLVSQHVAGAAVVRTRRLWIGIGGLCMGIGIWAMHFVGMLAFSLPCGSRYDPIITLLSMVPGILASTLAMAIVSRPALSRRQLVTGGLLLGGGIGAMHYSGMAAMRLDGLIRYDLKLFLLSLLVAVALATLALWIGVRLRAWRASWKNRVPVVSALVMGSAVSGMHYTAMAAAYFISDGNAGQVDSQVTPTFLASMVLTATGVIIVITIAASYVARPSLFPLRRSYRTAALLICAWVGIAWLSSDYYYGRLGAEVYRQESQVARRLADQVAADIDGNVGLLKGVSRVVAGGSETRQALLRLGPDVPPSSLAREVRRQRWSSDPALAALGRSLAAMAANLGADVVWVVNAAGDCIAASNFDRPTSFVGTNYADRDYFTQARRGLGGHQYAVGRATGVPGLFYSAPVFVDGRFLGAAVVKRDIVRFADWTRPAHAFIADANGIIVLAADKALENRALPGATIARLSREQRLLQYRRDRFEPLAVMPWQGDRYPDVVLMGPGGAPAVLASRVLPEDAISVHVARPVGELVRFDVERNWLFVLLGVAGSMLIVAASAVLLYLRQSQRVETDLRIAAAAFDVQEGMMITDVAGTILRVNQAFTAITGFAADEAIGRTPRLLSSGQHDGAFYAGMWQQLRESGNWQGEIWNRRKNGEVYPEWLSITAVKGVGGEITHYVGSMIDISHRKAAEDEIRNLAFYDPLTRLPNRRLLTDRLNQAMTASARSRHGGALLFIDLDNFKTLNDSLGHDRGDALLDQVAQRLLACVREGDTVARFGGDEFVVVLEDLSGNPDEAAGQTRLVGEKVLAALNRPYPLGSHLHHSTSSIGATLFFGHGGGVDELLKQADMAMYQAKAAGRNVMRFFDQDMQAVVSARAALEGDLHRGLQRDEFVLHFQPQVDAEGRWTGAEALLRWRHPEQGLVPPDRFIPLAEETGLILPLGRWVLEAACMQLVAWGGRPETARLTLAVNVSVHQFRQPEFVQGVLAVIERTGADPALLKLEITESLLVENVEDVIAKMASLKARGVGFALDDFGTGYSSLAYLKRLPLDQLKIDRSFVRDVLTDPNDAAIARTVIALAQSLGLAVIAEGVELAAQRDFLARAGCLAYQGYLFARPLPADEFARVLAAA